MKGKFIQILEKNQWLIALVSSIAILLTVFKRKEIMTAASNTVTDVVSELRINTLHPQVRDKARSFINEAEKQGIKLRVTSALRTWAEQDKLYAQGRTVDGAIVTNAKGGQSLHNFGLAFDVVPMVDGKADWKSKQWNQIGQLGKSFGFAWGGDFTTIKDMPHFQMTFGNSLATLQNLYTAGLRSGEYVNLA